MTAMFRSDMVWLRSMLPQTAGLLVFFTVICLMFSEEALTVFVPLVCFTLPFSYMANLFATDELNGWQAFRLALPLSRGQVVAGRAATGLVVVLGAFAAAMAIAAVWALALGPSAGDARGGAVVAGAVACAVSLVVIGGLMPFVARFGFTKAVRYLPMAAMLVMILGVWVGKGVLDSVATGWLEHLDAWVTALAADPLMLAGCMGAVLAAGIAVYGLLCLLAGRLYARREF